MPRFLAFDIAGRRFALAAEVVREVTRAVTIAPLPRAPAIVEGVINVRGQVVPVLDVRSRFGLPPQSLAPEQHFLIAQAAERLVALRVDRALEFVSVEPAAIESVARAAPGAKFVAGVAALPDGVLVIHDLAAFLSLDEARELESATRAAARESL